MFSLDMLLYITIRFLYLLLQQDISKWFICRPLGLTKSIWVRWMWIYQFVSVSPFITEQKSLDHVDWLPNIVHRADCLIGCNDYQWCVVLIRPVQNIRVIYMNERSVSDVKPSNPSFSLKNNSRIKGVSAFTIYWFFFSCKLYQTLVN